jgi:hypothetical protein
MACHRGQGLKRWGGEALINKFKLQTFYSQIKTFRRMKMKKTLFGALVIVSLLVGAIGAASADEAGVSSLPSGGWWEASLVMNTGDAEANVVLTPILGLGAPTTTFTAETTTIAMGASYNFMPGQYGGLDLGDGFQGSAVVSSDQPIVAIGSVANNMIGDIGVSGGRAAAQYSGISQDDVATSVAFPIVKADYKGKTTTFYIQTVEAGTIYATYSMNNGANTYTAMATTTEAGQMATFSPEDATGMPTGCSTDVTCVGAATFTSTVQLAGVYAEHNTVDNPGQVLLSTRGFTPGDFGMTVLIPAVKSVWVGRTTGIQIMNVGNAPADIDVTLAYQDGGATAAGGKVINFPLVPAGTSVTYFPGNHTTDDTLLGPFGGGAMNEFLGSATITSLQPMVAIVNENDFAIPTRTKQTVYAGFAAGSDTVLFPLTKEFYNGNTTGLQIMNIGAGTVTLSADYVCTKNTFAVAVNSAGAPISVASGTSFTFWGVTQYWNGAFDAYRGDYCAVSVTATGTGATIVGIAQEAEWPGGGLNYLDTKNYEGFNQ